MSAKSQHNNILLAIIGFATVVILVAIIGFFTLGKKPEIVQGEIEVSEYRVSSKLPGRILELRIGLLDCWLRLQKYKHPVCHLLP